MQALACALVLLALVALAGSARAESPPADSARGPVLEGRGVSRIELEGLGITKEYVVRRELKTRPGAPLESVLVERDRNRLLNLGIFSRVAVDTVADGDSALVRYQLTSLPWLIPYPRVSYTVENGWSFGLGIASPNLTGRAITLGASGTIGGADQGNLNFRHPWIAGDHLSIELGGARGVRRDEMNDFGETSTEAFATLGSFFGDYGRGELTGRYLEIQSDVNGKTLSPANRDEMFVVEMNGGFDDRDRYEDPHRGWQSEGFLSWTGGAGSRPANFWTGQLDLRRYIPTGTHQKILLAGLGTIRSGRVGENVPMYLQYYMGGANTIRGYDLFVLGPTLFGKNQTILTAEYQWTFVPPHDVTILSVPLRYGVQAAAFADWGIAWTGEEEFSSDRGKGSIGVGLRLLIPGINMVRFDFGVGDDETLRFAFGASVKMDAQKKRVR